MRITESKLRRIVRSVILESNVDEIVSKEKDDFKERLGFNDKSFAEFYNYVHGKEVGSKIYPTQGWGASGALYANATFGTRSFRESVFDEMLDELIKNKYNDSPEFFYTSLAGFHRFEDAESKRNGNDDNFKNVMKHLVTTFRSKEVKSSREYGLGYDGLVKKANSTFTESLLKMFVNRLEEKLEKIFLDSVGEF